MELPLLASLALPLLFCAPSAADDAPAPYALDDVSLPAFPELGEATALEEGALFRELRVGEAPARRLWLYLPAGEHAPASLPAVLIAPAGSNLATGMALAEGDRPEHLPYVRAGFAVLAYELSGAVPEDADDEQFVGAIERFMAASAGLADARVALELLLARVPAVDPRRVFAAGHSSAASHALLFAAHEPRLAGCVAFAPVVDVQAHWGAELVEEIDQDLPGFQALVLRSSPGAHVARIACPVFLFQAEDDELVALETTRGFAKQLRRKNRRVELSTVEEGGHYEPMIDVGIPRAVQWLEKTAEAAAKAKRGAPEKG